MLYREVFLGGEFPEMIGDVVLLTPTVNNHSDVYNLKFFSSFVFFSFQSYYTPKTTIAIYFHFFYVMHRLGSRRGAVVRGLASHHYGAGSIPARGHIWVEFVVGSRVTPRLFLRVLRFSSLHKNQHSKFQFDQDREPA